MAIELRKAQRKRSKLRIGLSGPSGSGKTLSALLISRGITTWEKMVLIDTERGSGELYSDRGPYNIISLSPPFTPEIFIEAIKKAEAAGMEVIIIDSSSHEWDGEGGCLESNELLGQTKFKGNNWAAWSVTTPRHQKFIQALTGSRCHMITTVRSKTDMIQTEDKKIKKVGMKDIQRDGYEYEFTVTFNLDRDKHYAVAGKDRTGIFSEADPFVITTETGKALLEWVNSGAEIPEVKMIDAEQDKAIKELAAKLETPWEKINQWVLSVKKIGIYELTQEQATNIIGLLQARLVKKEEERKAAAETAATLAEVEKALAAADAAAQAATPPAPTAPAVVATAAPATPEEEMAKAEAALDEVLGAPVEPTYVPVNEPSAAAVLMRKGMQTATKVQTKAKI